MAIPLAELVAAERERVESHLAPLKAAVLRRDPGARFRLRPGHLAEFWELDAYVRPDLADDPDLGAELAELETDLLLEHDSAVLVLPHRRAGPGTVPE